MMDFEASVRDGESARLTSGGRDSRLAGATQALNTLVQVFEVALRLLSPFMPFLSEELWHAVYDGEPPAKSVALTRYPTRLAAGTDEAVESMLFLQNVISAIRAVRKDVGVEERALGPVEVRTPATAWPSHTSPSTGTPVSMRAPRAAAPAA